MMPEDVKVKENFVVDDWDYPEAKEYPIIVVIEKTQRKEFFKTLVAKLDYPTLILKDK